MEFSAEGIAAIIVALAGLISGVYNLFQARKVQIQKDLEKLEKENDTLKVEKRESERLLEIAIRHIHALNLVLARNGIDEVPVPEALR
jgi:uncharacterized protein HemX